MRFWNKITNNSKRSILYLIIAALFLLLINIGYLNYAFHATPEYQYTGANPYAAADKLVYMSMIEQGREGILFMKNLHTIEPQKGLLLSPHWFIIGQTAHIFGLSNNAAYQLYRLIFTVLFLGLLYAVLKKLFNQQRDRFLAALFVLFSGGVGWYFIVLHPEVLNALRGVQKFFLLPIDIYVTEGNTLLNFSQSPLFSLSQLLLVLVFYLFIRYRNAQSFRWDLVNAAVVAVLGIIHPYDIPIIFTVLGSWSLWYFYRTHEWLIFQKMAIVLTGGVLGSLYNVYVLFADPVLAGWLKQNLVYSPPLINYLWGYGLLIPLWFVGVIDIFRTKRENPWWMLVVMWSLIIWILLYVPLEINRRFINGFHIVLALVAYVGFRYLYEQIQRRWLRPLFITVTGIVVFSSVIFFLVINLFFSASAYTYGYYYITEDERGAIEFLKSHSATEDRLLVSDEMTPFSLTSQLNRPVFWGMYIRHRNHTCASRSTVGFFYSQSGSEYLNRKQQFLRDNSINYIVVNQTRLTQPIDWLSSAAFLDEVYQSGDITIYQLIP